MEDMDPIKVLALLRRITDEDVEVPSSTHTPKLPASALPLLPPASALPASALPVLRRRLGDVNVPVPLPLNPQ